MPAFEKTDPIMRPASELFGTRKYTIDEYKLAVEVEPRGRVSVRYHFSAGMQQAILVGDAADYATLIGLLDAERDRMAEEISTDARGGGYGDPSEIVSFSELDDRCDANVYPAGGRSVDRSWGDETMGWSDKKTEAHAKALLAHGVIGKGVSTPTHVDTAASESFTGFQNAATHAVDRWLRLGGLAARLNVGTSPRP